MVQLIILEKYSHARRIKNIIKYRRNIAKCTVIDKVYEENN